MINYWWEGHRWWGVQICRPFQGKTGNHFWQGRWNGLSCCRSKFSSWGRILKHILNFPFFWYKTNILSFLNFKLKLLRDSDSFKIIHSTNSLRCKRLAYVCELWSFEDCCTQIIFSMFFSLKLNLSLSSCYYWHMRSLKGCGISIYLSLSGNCKEMLQEFHFVVLLICGGGFAHTLFLQFAVN